MQDFEKLVGKCFPLDRAHLKECFYTAEGIEFSFEIDKKENISSDSISMFGNIREEKIKDEDLEIQEKLENSDRYNIQLLNVINDFIEKKLKEI